MDPQCSWIIFLTFTVLTATVTAQFHYGGNQCCEEYCYGTDRDRPQSRQFATKTAYQIVHASETDRQTFVPNCQPVKFWLLSRHGTRLPSASDISKLTTLPEFRNEVIANYEQRRSKPDTGALCSEDLNLLKNWRWNQNITMQYEQFLTGQGWNDLKYMAIRYQRDYRNLLDNIYVPDNFRFGHTKAERTTASYKAFVEGLFGEKQYENLRQPIIDDGILLKPYDSCPAWNTQKENSKNPNSEFVRFQNSKPYQKMLSDVSLRLGFRFNLSSSQIKPIWDMCRYDQAWELDRFSPWCAAFTPNQVKVLEYAEDLAEYYESGYGNELNSVVACSAIADMMRHMDGQGLPKSIAYFTHTTEIILFITALGAYRDNQPLRSDNYNQMEFRKFRTSVLSPFAGNVAVVKYDCPTDPERTKLMFLLNEKPMDIAWCNIGLCNWSAVRDRLKRYTAGNCDKIYCGGSSATTWTISIVGLIVSVLITVF